MNQKSKAYLILAFIFLGFIATTLLPKCSSKNIEYNKRPPDTTNTFVQFVSPLDWPAKIGVAGNQGYFTQAWRLTKDTFAFDSADATTMKKIWKRDTVYVFEVHIQPKDTTGGKMDSVIYPVLTPKHILVDYNKNPNFNK